MSLGMTFAEFNSSKSHMHIYSKENKQIPILIFSHAKKQQYQ